jgi:hypothetical protein
MYPLGKALTEILPGGIDVQSHLWFSLNANADTAVEHDLPDGQRRIVNILKEFPGGLSAGPLKKLLGRKDIYHEIRTLQTRGLVVIDDRIERPKVSLKKEQNDSACWLIISAAPALYLCRFSGKSSKTLPPWSEIS